MVSKFILTSFFLDLSLAITQPANT